MLWQGSLLLCLILKLAKVWAEVWVVQGSHRLLLSLQPLPDTWTGLEETPASLDAQAAFCTFEHCNACGGPAGFGDGGEGRLGSESGPTWQAVGRTPVLAGKEYPHVPALTLHVATWEEWWPAPVPGHY